MDGMIKVETLEELQPTNDEVRCAVKVECEDLDSFHYQKIEPDVIIPEVKMEDDPLENVGEDVECVVKEEYKDVPCCYQSVEPDTIVPELNMDHDPLEDDCEDPLGRVKDEITVEEHATEYSTHKNSGNVRARLCSDLLPKRRKGQTIHREAREVIRSVINVCDWEASQQKLLFPVQQATMRAAQYCGVSTRTIKVMRKEAKELLNKPCSSTAKLTIPEKQRPRDESRKATLDSFDLLAIRNTIYDLYIDKKVPSLSKLMLVLKDKISFPWKEETLKRVLLKIGFKWKKCQTPRKLLVESPSIVFWRLKYLQTLRKLREEGRQIFYMDESWIDSSFKFRKCWQNGVLTENTTTRRFISLHVGSERGFLKQAGLVFRAGGITGDYHGPMNTSNFHKWIDEKLLTSLPPQSVLVIDNAPYHCVQVDKPPSKYAPRANMMEWLRKRDVQCDSSMRKHVLYDLIEQHKPKEKKYHVDEILYENGHTVMRLLPYMCEMNPMELAWAKVKQVIKKMNVSGDLTFKSIEKVISTALDCVTAEDWTGYVEHVKKIEQEYLEKDGIVEECLDNIILSLRNGSYEGSSDDSDDVSDSDDDDDDMDCNDQDSE